jgi:hypothetical protein
MCEQGRPAATNYRMGFAEWWRPTTARGTKEDGGEAQVLDFAHVGPLWERCECDRRTHHRSQVAPSCHYC